MPPHPVTAGGSSRRGACGAEVSPSVLDNTVKDMKCTPRQSVLFCFSFILKAEITQVKLFMLRFDIC